MYLAEIFAENFRIFGNADPNPEQDQSLRLRLSKGLNALVGPNDSGKTAIVDAIRYCLWTTSQEYFRLTEDDFHCDSNGRALELTIRCKFEELSEDDQATFLEWLTTPPEEPPSLFVTLRARQVALGSDSRVSVTVHAGERGEGPALEGTVREMLRTTYLRPLRDAEGELRPGRRSRLSQILLSHPEIAKEERDDWDEEADTASTLVGIVRRAEHHIKSNPAVTSARDDINENYLASFSIADDELSSEVGVASDSSLGRVLEKLELRLAKTGSTAAWTRRGLGYNNALFMSAELLLLGTREKYSTLLIEEPEAHLHPQLQSRVTDLLNEKTKPKTGDSVQVVLTTHSPNLASSIPLTNLVLVSDGRTFDMSETETQLAAKDYAFLERFLDVTKANLFFARAVMIVEGDAEALLLPTLARVIGLPLGKHGVSIVNVGHTGLFRYSNIFRRRKGPEIPIRVACLRDRDIVPDAANDDLRGSLKRASERDAGETEVYLAGLTANDGGPVRTFVSDSWTFEHDLAAASWKMASLMHQAVASARKAAREWPPEADLKSAQASAADEVEAWRADGSPLANVALEVFVPLRTGAVSKTITAQFAAKLIGDSNIESAELPKYIQDAMAHVCGTG